MFSCLDHLESRPLDANNGHTHLNRNKLTSTNTTAYAMVNISFCPATVLQNCSLIVINWACIKTQVGQMFVILVDVTIGRSL